MAVSSYTYDTLPEAEQQALPTVEQIAAALDWTTTPPTDDTSSKD
ncbi:hypothetical protein GCM10022256_22090 [Frondihabitans peucedani]|uniref:Uncharacterized protein n=1 Tax=Frondihabitans peucedani TaxID=598626 RepID=A0ABP8E361_9MICO